MKEDSVGLAAFLFPLKMAPLSFWEHGREGASDSEGPSSSHCFTVLLAVCPWTSPLMSLTSLVHEDNFAVLLKV